MSNLVSGDFYIVSKSNGYYPAMDADFLYFRPLSADPIQDRNFHWSYVKADDAGLGDWGLIVNHGDSEVITLDGPAEQEDSRFVLVPVNNEKKGRQRLELINQGQGQDNSACYKIKVLTSGMFLTKKQDDYVCQESEAHCADVNLQQFYLKSINA